MLKRLWPYFLTFAVSVVLLVIDLWANYSTVASSVFGKWVEPYTDESKFSVIWTFFLLISVITLWRLSYDKQEEAKKELEARMNSQLGMLAMANQELSSYRERDILVRLFRRFVSLNAYVIGVQLYEYSLQHSKGMSSFKLTLIDGYARENIDVNASQQLHYTFDIGLYREFRDAYDQSFSPIPYIPDLADEVDILPKEMDGSFEVDPAPIMAFIQKYNYRLSVKPIQGLTQEDAMEYAFVNACVRLLERAAGYEIEYFLEPEKKDKLESFKRLGSLQTLLCQCPITFSHIRRNEKADRQYIACPVIINQRQYMFMILLDPEILNDSMREEIMDGLSEGFERNLVKCFESIYNSDRNKKGDGENAD